MSSQCIEHSKCIDSALEWAEEICAKNGSRLTDLRRRVLELTWAGHEPVKAYDLLTELQKEDPAAKPPTVYRALDFLLEHGLVHKIHRLNAYVGCVDPGESRPCYFLICSNCHKVTESHDEEYYELIKSISKNHHFHSKETTLEVEGLCIHCV